MNIGNRLEKFWKQNESLFPTKSSLAQALGISYHGLQAYFTDKNKPGADFLIKLHDLGCDINWLLTGKETKRENIESILLENRRLNELLRNISDSIDLFNNNNDQEGN